MPSKHIFDEAFAQRPDLRQRVLGAIAKAPEQESLFGDIAHYIKHVQNASIQEQFKGQDEQPFKKRKLEHRPIDTGGWDKKNVCKVTDVSFSIPQRKKLHLSINKSASSGLHAINASGTSEFGVSWEWVRDIVCLPVPEKAQAQYNFCIFSTTADGLAPDQIVWTVPDSVPKDGTFVGLTTSPGETCRTLLITVLNEALKPYKKRVIEPDKQEFASQVVQAHRRGEPAYHIKAFRGSKDGFLFLLANGIFWGFKKPLEFFSFDSVDSVSYTSVLQRTFNLNIAARAATDAEPQEFEFSMIDQADFAGIDDYVKRHELQDASMAEQRRAKKLNVNGLKGNETKQEGVDQEEGELEKATREAEDLEDEEEDDENFDPGSEGESEGSGSGSDEDEDEREGRAGSNVVDEELGSEAESA
ncbi:hypothetical protein HO173_010654 [Letharia columbiana]|uniref:Histone chaperone RTT106/FACT complex subunit SPT16-like middle domain-containing protein n=1 Tax=Letharia columbiana TaxID=112416 RepID=A0A8H6FMB0_9LECA|nr:uncharacterized protein HO173_010654 [Letharia columbiana]KAF6231154.1 hypothetical protein HO173_010654 [Letharia columbiana]